LVRALSSERDWVKDHYAKQLPVGGVIDRNTTRYDYAGKLTFKINNSHTIESTVSGDPSHTNPTAFSTLNIDNTSANSKWDYGTRQWSTRYDGAFGSSLLVDAAFTFPAILFALLLAVTMGQGLGTLVIAITLLLWASFARVIRGEVLSLRQRDFVALARVRGCSAPRIMLTHILPNVLNTFMVLVTLNIGVVIIAEATLSFLGAGIPPPTPSWGLMISEGRGRIADAWWVALIPGIAITLMVLSVNLFGDWLRDRLDPRLRQL